MVEPREKVGQYLWTQRYDRLNREIFDLQDEITREIVSALQVELTEGDPVIEARREAALKKAGIPE